MKWFFRIFFRTLRAVLGPLLLLWDRLTTPKGMVRPEQDQRQVDSQTRGLVLYQYRTCPFCIKVRRTIKRLSLNIETRDAQKDARHRDQLLQGGGQIKVPCLKIVDDSGDDTWLYESNEIVQYLQERFA